MNKTFKTIWNEARRSYIVTNEAQKTHGKPSKSAVALAVAAAAALVAGTASAAYVEEGVLGSTHSWESEEYGNATATKAGQHGLTHINASTAYAEGYTGKGVLIGVVDSGALLSHSELSGGRIFGVTASGTYSKDGTRYPFAYIGQTGQADNRYGAYSKGESFTINGDWVQGHNDSHGTHVTSVVAGNRDGEYSHGVAFEADIAVGNTGGSDNMNYGPYQDYGYFYAVWDAVGATGAKVINNSWGTNIRVNNDTSQHFNVGYQPEDLADGSNEPGPDEYPTPAGQGAPKDFLGEDAEYYMFMEDAEKNGGKNFMDAAYEVAAKYGLIQIFTNGNRQFQNPFYRAAYPYYNPEAEKYWIAAGGVDVDASGKESIMGWGKKNDQTGASPDGGNTYNRAGIAKWWTITSPTNVLGASVNSTTGEATTGIAGGTSNAAPHIAGTMAVLLQRFGSYMTPTQVRDVMFTTARQTQWGTDDPLPGITQDDLGTTEDDYGWGIIDLSKAIYGPGQFFGTFDVTMNGVDDVWHNSISDTAIKDRGVEDAAEAKDLKVRIDELKNIQKAWSEATEEEREAEDSQLVEFTDELRWELGYKEKRLAAIEERTEQDYVGKLIKRGDGVLTMTEANTYTGGTEIYGGTVAGLTESFGSGDVTVKDGATVELHKSFAYQKAGEEDWVNVTSKGTVDNTGDDAKIVLEKGATLALAGDGISIQSLKVNGEAYVAASGFSDEQLASVYSGETEELTVSAEVTGELTGAESLKSASEYAFFESSNPEVADKVIRTSLKKGEATMASVATTAAGAAIGAAIESAPESDVFKDFVSSSTQEVLNTYDSLGSDLHMAVQNATIVNATTLARTIKDQATHFGSARTATLDNGIELWATGIGSWSNVDAGGASVDMDVDYYAGFIGGEMAYGDDNKVGVFFGYGSTESDADADGKVESDDIHLGVYGENVFNQVGVAYGFTYTMQDRDSSRALLFKDQLGFNAVSYDADVMQLFGEVSYKGFNSDAFSVEPYVGLSYMRVSADSFTETVAGHSVTTELDDQNVGVGMIGVRGSVPFSLGSVGMAVKGDVAYMQYFGDNEATAKMRIGDAGVAELTGEELTGMGAVSLGVDAALGKNTTFGLSYTGAYGSDVTSHGVSATLRVAF